MTARPPLALCGVPVQRSFKPQQAQKTPTRMIDKNLNLQEKTNRLGLFNLANLKLRGDEVTCCKNSIENSREKLF